MAILEEADIVCSTLSFSGAGLFERMSRPFDVVVIDEAAQAVEPSTLVPMVLGCQQVAACARLSVKVNYCFCPVVEQQCSTSRHIERTFS